MERKLVRQGRNALTVTLPASWLKAKGLQAGDVVQVEEGNKELRISVGAKSGRKECTLDVKGLDKGIVWNLVLGKYIEGYDTISLLNSDLKTAQSLGQELLGMILEEQTEKKTVLKNMISIPENTFEPLFRHTAYMFLHQARMIEELANGKLTFEEVKKQERLIDRNIYYCMRYLNKYHNQEHAYRYFLLCSTLELAADQLSNIAKYMKKEKMIAKKLVEVLELYTKYLFSKDLEKLSLALRNYRPTLDVKNFLEGLIYSLVEILHNNLGYLTSEAKL